MCGPALSKRGTYEREILRALRKDPIPYHAMMAVADPAIRERAVS